MNTLPEIVLRVAVVAAGLGLWFWTQRLIGRKPPPAGALIGDRLHASTAPLHAWLSANPRAADATLVVTSACVDAFGLYLLGSAVLGASVQPFLAILIVFGLRQVCQMTVTLPPPPGIIWRHPGVPSLLVTYEVSNDFFFSGHTAISVLGALQLAHHAPWWLVLAGAMIAAIEALTVIVLRAHYTMDVIAAIFVAWSADIVAQRLAPQFDLWLAKLHLVFGN